MFTLPAARSSRAERDRSNAQGPPHNLTSFHPATISRPNKPRKQITRTAKTPPSLSTPASPTKKSLVFSDNIDIMTPVSPQLSFNPSPLTGHPACRRHPTEANRNRRTLIPSHRIPKPSLTLRHPGLRLRAQQCGKLQPHPRRRLELHDNRTCAPPQHHTPFPPTQAASPTPSIPSPTPIPY